MQTETILLIIIPVLTAIISSYLTYYFAMKSKRTEAILKFKEEKYSNLLVLLQGFVGRTASGKTKREFLEEQYKSWLYCSDGVVQAINAMVQLVIAYQGGEPDHVKGKEVVGKIVLEMRKDLLKKTNLSTDDFVYIDVIDK